MDTEDTSHGANPSEIQETETKMASPDEDVLGKEINNSENSAASKQGSTRQYQDSTMKKSDKEDITVDKVMESEENPKDLSGFKTSEYDNNFSGLTETSVSQATQSDQEDTAGTKKQEGSENTKLVVDSQKNQNSGLGKKDVGQTIELYEAESPEISKQPTNRNESVGKESWIKIDLQGNTPSGCTLEETEVSLTSLQKVSNTDLTNIQASHKDSEKESSADGGNKTHDMANDSSVPPKPQTERQQKYNKITQTEQDTEKDKMVKTSEKADDNPNGSYSTDDTDDYSRHMNIR